MDPIASLKLSYRIIDKAVDGCRAAAQIHESDAGLADDQASLETLATSMKTAAENFSDAEKFGDRQITKAAEECKAACESIAVELNKCRAKRRGSIASASRAAAKICLNKQELDEQQKRLERWSQVLNNLVTSSVQYALPLPAHTNFRLPC